MKNVFSSLNLEHLDYESLDDITEGLISGLKMDDPLLRTAIGLQSKAIVLYLAEYEKKKFNIYNFFRMASLSIDDIDLVFSEVSEKDQTSKCVALYATLKSFPNETRKNAQLILSGQAILKYLPLFSKSLNNPIEFNRSNKFKVPDISQPLNAKKNNNRDNNIEVKNFDKNKSEEHAKAKSDPKPNTAPVVDEDDFFNQEIPSAKKFSSEENSKVISKTSGSSNDETESDSSNTESSLDENSGNISISDEELFFQDGLKTFGGGDF